MSKPYIIAVLGIACLCACDPSSQKQPFERFETTISVPYRFPSDLQVRYEAMFGTEVEAMRVLADIVLDVRHAERVIYLSWRNFRISKGGREVDGDISRTYPGAVDKGWQEAVRVARAAYPDYELRSR